MNAMPMLEISHFCAMPSWRSLPAIEDIRDCLQNTNLHRKFVAVFRKALQDRLLHPGGSCALGRGRGPAACKWLQGGRVRLAGLGRAQVWLLASVRGRRRGELWCTLLCLSRAVSRWLFQFCAHSGPPPRPPLPLGILPRAPPNSTHTAHTHPGAATSDIIQQYVSAIKALAHIDPAGAILGAVGGPIRAYLRQRRDTIRCVVTMLTADEEDAAAASLHAELGNAEAAPEVGAERVECVWARRMRIGGGMGGVGVKAEPEAFYDGVDAAGCAGQSPARPASMLASMLDCTKCSVALALHPLSPVAGL